MPETEVPYEEINLDSLESAESPLVPARWAICNIHFPEHMEVDRKEFLRLFEGSGYHITFACKSYITIWNAPRAKQEVLEIQLKELQSAYTDIRIKFPVHGSR